MGGSEGPDQVGRGQLGVIQGQQGPDGVETLGLDGEGWGTRVGVLGIGILGQGWGWDTRHG